MRKEQYQPDDIKDGKCPECGSKILRVSAGSVTCGDCGETIGKRFNKYGAKRTKAADGVVRDSKFEASVADDLLLRKRAGDILDYESQYKVIMPVCRSDGSVAFTVSHKVDFRVHLRDGSYELLEAKGVATGDYLWRRRLLEELWLPMHLDHVYTVIQQRVRR